MPAVKKKLRLFSLIIKVYQPQQSNEFGRKLCFSEHRAIFNNVGLKPMIKEKKYACTTI